jgi:hypothetical protein
MTTNRPKPLPVGTSLSPAEQIALNHYEVMVPRLFLQSADAAAFYGSMAQDNPMAQREQEQGDMRVNLPATKLAELYAKGCKPWFIDHPKAAKMYRELVGYLKAAVVAFDQTPNSGRWTPEMMDNLMKLENFAQWLHGVALPFLTEEDVGPPRDTLAGYNRRTPMGRLSQQQQEDQRQQAEHLAPDHTRVVDELVERQVARGRRGWS